MLYDKKIYTIGLSHIIISRNVLNFAGLFLMLSIPPIILAARKIRRRLKVK